MSDEFAVKDSGKRREFATGSLRDTDEGKPRPDLISPHARKRMGTHLARGAKKYGERNWEKGQPVSQYIASLERHLLQYELGNREEDHLSAILFNAHAIIHFEEEARLGSLVALEMLDAYASKKLADELREDFSKARVRITTASILLTSI